MTRILFVDDEPMLLRAIDRGLRSHKARWQARFVSSGAGALELLDREQFDVIVSDIGMPEMDGVALLASVRTRFPHIARLALSGQFARRDEVRAAVVVHQWLAKPCPLVELCATIERLTWTRALIDDPYLTGVIGQLASLPSPPALYARVSAALERSAPIPEIVALIEADPAIVAKLLQLVNSSFFSFAARITSIQRAVSVIGSDSLRNLVLAAELFRTAGVTPDHAANSRLVAQLARELAPRELANDAFVAGLLHDIGQLALAGLPTPPAPSPIIHARLAGLLLGTWGLPTELVTAVAFHRDPDSGPNPGDRLLRLIALATTLASALASGLPAGEPTPEIDAASAALGRDPASSREIAARVRDQLTAELDLAK